MSNNNNDDDKNNNDNNNVCCACDTNEPNGQLSLVSSVSRWRMSILKEEEEEGQQLSSEVEGNFFGDV